MSNWFIWPSRALGTILAGFALWQASEALRRELDGWPVKQLAARVEQRGVPDAQFWTSRASALQPDDRLSCHNKVGKAQLTLALAALDTASGTDESRERDDRRDKAIALARRNLECAPLDGNIWLRLAMLEIGAGGLSDDVMRAFDLSDRFAPAEGWVLEQRIPFYADLAARNVEGFAGRAIRDLTVYARWGGSVDKALAYMAIAPDILLPALKAAIAESPRRRQQAFWSAADRLDLKIGQPTKDRNVDFDPFDAPSNRTK